MIYTPVPEWWVLLAGLIAIVIGLGLGYVVCLKGRRVQNIRDHEWNAGYDRAIGRRADNDQFLGEVWDAGCAHGVRAEAERQAATRRRWRPRRAQANAEAPEPDPMPSPGPDRQPAMAAAPTAAEDLFATRPISQPERACRQCGCTQDRACPGGCSWVAADLCSACLPAELLDEAEAPTIIGRWPVPNGHTVYPDLVELANRDEAEARHRNGRPAEIPREFIARHSRPRYQPAPVHHHRPSEQAIDGCGACMSGSCPGCAAAPGDHCHPLCIIGLCRACFGIDPRDDLPGQQRDIPPLAEVEAELPIGARAARAVTGPGEWEPLNTSEIPIISAGDDLAGSRSLREYKLRTRSWADELIANGHRRTAETLSDIESGSWWGDDGRPEGVALPSARARKAIGR